MSALFCDEIPTRDDSPSPMVYQGRRTHTRSQFPQKNRTKSASPVSLNVNGSSKTHVSSGRSSARRMTVHEISKAFDEDTVSRPIIPKLPSQQTFTDQLTTPVRLKRSQSSPAPDIGVEPFSVVSRNIYNLWQNNQFCDVRITAGGRQFLAHKLIMAASCAVFSKDEDHQTPIAVELDIQNVSADAMNDVLKFFYTHRVSVSGHNVDSFLKIARDLNIREIAAKCKEFLRDVNKENFIYNKYIAHKHGLLDIVEYIDKFSKENVLELAKLQSFIRSEFQLVYDIISSGLLSTASELDLFLACASWIDFNRTERLRYTVPLMGLIRFTNISADKLASDVEPVQYIFDVPECKDMLYNAFKHHALLHEFMLPSSKEEHMPVQQQTSASIVRAHSQNDQLSKSSASIVRAHSQKDELFKSDASIGRERVQSEARVDSVVSKSSTPLDVSSRQGLNPVSSHVVSLPRPHSAHSVRATRDELSITQSESSNDDEVKFDLPSPPRSCVILVMGGLNNFDSSDTDDKRIGDISQIVHQYEPTVNIWSALTHLPLPLHHCGTVSLAGYIYVIGGTRPNYHGDLLEVTASCHRYDPTTNDWKNAGRLQTPRSELAVVVLNNVIYAIGGADSDGNSLNSMEFYNAEDDRWYYTAAMNDARVGLAAATHRGEVVVLGGMLGLQEGYLLDSIESYNPATDRWTIKSPFPIPVCHASMTEVNGLLYTVGGYMLTEGSNALSLDNIFRYREEDDVWETFVSLRIPRHDALVTSLGSRLYVIGGISSATIGNALSNVECFDVETGYHIDGIAPLPTPAYGCSGCAIAWDF